MADSYYRQLKVSSSSPPVWGEVHLEANTSAAEVVKQLALLADVSRVEIEKMRVEYEKLPESMNFSNYQAYKNGMKLEVDARIEEFKLYDSPEKMRNVTFIETLQDYIRRVKSTQEKLATFNEQVSQMNRYKEALAALQRKIIELKETVMTELKTRLTVPVLASIANNVINRLDILYKDITSGITKISNVVDFEHMLGEFNARFFRLETYWNNTIQVNLDIVVQRLCVFQTRFEQKEKMVKDMNELYVTKHAKMGATYLTLLAEEDEYTDMNTRLTPTVFRASALNEAMMDPDATPSVPLNGVAQNQAERTLNLMIQHTGAYIDALQHVENALKTLLDTIARVNVEIQDIYKTGDLFLSMLNRTSPLYVGMNGRMATLKTVYTDLNNLRVRAVADVNVATGVWAAFDAVMLRYTRIKTEFDGYVRVREEVEELKRLRQETQQLETECKRLITTYNQLGDVYFQMEMQGHLTNVENEVNAANGVFTAVMNLAAIQACVITYRGLKTHLEGVYRILATNQRYETMRVDANFVGVLIKDIRYFVDENRIGYVGFIFVQYIDKIRAYDNANALARDLKARGRQIAANLRTRIDRRVNIVQDTAYLRGVLRNAQEYAHDVETFYTNLFKYDKLRTCHEEVVRQLVNIYAIVPEVGFEDDGGEYANALAQVNAAFVTFDELEQRVNSYVTYVEKCKHYIEQNKDMIADEDIDDEDREAVDEAIDAIEERLAQTQGSVKEDKVSEIKTAYSVNLQNNDTAKYNII